MCKKIMNKKIFFFISLVFVSFNCLLSEYRDIDFLNKKYRLVNDTPKTFGFKANRQRKDTLPWGSNHIVYAVPNKNQVYFSRQKYKKIGVKNQKILNKGSKIASSTDNFNSFTYEDKKNSHDNILNDFDKEYFEGDEYDTYGDYFDDLFSDF